MTHLLRALPLSLLCLLLPACALLDGGADENNSPEDNSSTAPNVTLPANNSSTTPAANNKTSPAPNQTTTTPATTPVTPPVLADVNIKQASAMHPGGNQRACLSVTCDSGQRALVGGAKFAGIALQKSAPRTDGSTWEVCGVSDVARPWEVHAVCATPSFTIQAVNSMERTTADAGMCVQNTCISGDLMSAGFDSGAFGYDALRRADQDTWQLCGIHPSPVTVEIFAQCISSELVQATTSQSVVHLGDNQDSCQILKCESDHTVVMGGTAWGGPLKLTQFYPLSTTQWIICGRSPEQIPGWFGEITCLKNSM